MVMKMSKSNKEKSPFYKGFFLFLPFPLCFCSILCLIIVLFETVVVSSPYFSVITNGIAGSAVSNTQKPIENDEGKIPAIFYGEQWATLNVEGWERKNIKVFFGDENALLKQGAGMWTNSRFCGQNGKVVLSAHVTSHFYELEDTNVGDRVTMDTVYGSYVYEVIKTVIFNYKDPSLLKPQSGEDILVMYTCYPRKNGYQFKTERLALICKKIEGKEWETYAGNA